MEGAEFAEADAFLRAHDPDRHLASLLLTGEARAGHVALHAFAADVAMIRERVSDPTLGEIRLQWWNDALTAGEAGAAGNPLAVALARTMSRYRIPAGTLQRLLGARRFDLYDDPMPDMVSFEGYAGETVSTLYQLTAMMLGGGEAVPEGDAAGHLGVAQALAGHVGAFGYHAARGRIVLPLSIFAAHGVGEGDILAGRDTPGLRAALAQSREMAESHADRAEAAIARLPAALRPAFAPIALVRRDLRALSRVQAGPFAVLPRPAAFPRLAALIWWAIRRAR